ncbi:hypothetical protein ACQJBY_018552 [Aegilops geniculata]
MDRVDTSGFVNTGSHCKNIDVYFYFVYTIYFLGGEVVKLGF